VTGRDLTVAAAAEAAVLVSDKDSVDAALGTLRLGEKKKKKKTKRRRLNLYFSEEKLKKKPYNCHYCEVETLQMLLL
jgi:hypothetical protein